MSALKRMSLAVAAVAVAAGLSLGSAPHSDPAADTSWGVRGPVADTASVSPQDTSWGRVIRVTPGDTSWGVRPQDTSWG